MAHVLCEYEHEGPNTFWDSRDDSSDDRKKDKQTLTLTYDRDPNFFFTNICLGGPQVYTL